MTEVVFFVRLTTLPMVVVLVYNVARKYFNLSPMSESELKKLLEENLALSKEIQAISKKTATYLKWLRITDILKILIILIPLIAAWLYLPNILSSFSAAYGEVLPQGLMK